MHYYILPSPSNTVYSIDLFQHFHSPGALQQVCLSSWHLLTCFDEEQGHFVSIDKQDDFVILDLFGDKFPIIITLLKQCC